MEKISKEIPSREEAPEEKLPEAVESIEEEQDEDSYVDNEEAPDDTEDLDQEDEITEEAVSETPEVEKPSVDVAEESDQDKRLRQVMEGRIEEANDMIADLTKKLEGRDLNSVPDASVTHANELEDKRDALKKQLDAGEVTPIEYARGIAPTVEALAKIIEAWERTTKGQMLEDSKE